jgi:ATP-dependent helicase/nuclease subunit B
MEVLDRHAGETIFASESREAPIQILGPHEAAGLTFDAIWFLGADDESWPAPARPHPFLTLRLQREKRMPHADVTLDWKLAEQITRRLLASAPRCVFSYARQDENGECRQSTLLDFAVEAMPDPETTSVMVAKLPEEQEAPQGVPWPVDQEAGGAEVLKLQAACPFRSFATKRLAARPMEETDWGLDARGRGIVVHRVLEALWKKLGSLDGLRESRKDGTLGPWITEQVKNELQGFGKHLHARNLSWSQTYLEAEEERISALIGMWLEYEEKRAPFTVEDSEREFPAAVGDLKLQVRVDRVDLVAGGRVIIDYKTGAVDTRAWDGKRPDEPQLLLYAGQVQDLKGLLLARVNAEQLKFAGRVQNAQVVMEQKDLTRPPLTPRMLSDWQEVLRSLGQQFLNGDAQVDPNHGHTTCEYCKLPALCRIAESGNQDDEDGDESDE